MQSKEIIKLAKKELEEEGLRREIDKMKLKLSEKRSLWDKVFPWKLVVVRKHIEET